MPFKTLLSFTCSALLVFTAMPASADSQALPTILQSGSNDIIRLQRGIVPGAETRIAPLSPSNFLGSGTRKSGAKKRSTRASRRASPSNVGGGVQVHKLRGAPQNFPTPPQGGQAAPATTPPILKLDERVAERLVTICLSNPGKNSGPKAFDVQRSDEPRYVAQPGEQICAKFEPTRQTVYFWKTNDLGKLSLTLSNRLDLSDSEGTQITLNWEQD